MKNVHFAPHPTIHNMILWRFKYNNSRKSINTIAKLFSPILDYKSGCNTNTTHKKCFYIGVNTYKIIIIISK